MGHEPLVPAAWPVNPVVYEVNAAVWLHEQSQRFGADLHLGTVPAEAWDQLALDGVDAVWLMGVWERSAAGRAVASSDPLMRGAIRTALPDAGEGDVVGSPYCVRRYVCDPSLGGPEGLATARRALAERGVRLVLDFVPNHVAPDHPWVTERPELFVHGTEADLARDPGAFVEIGGHVLARGRDPYFLPWPDVVQLDPTTAEGRDAAVEVLCDIAEQCDGVRCDMAMLVMNRVARQTWAGRVDPEPPEDYWPAVLGRVRAVHPELLLLAEAYWGLEAVLVEQGFDAVYDKGLYEAMVDGDAAGIRHRVSQPAEVQARRIRFAEHHDEERAPVAFGTGGLALAATAAVLTLPGVALLHEGQLEGRRTKVPVTLRRRPEEPVDEAVRAPLARVLGAIGGGIRRGSWATCACEGWLDNQSCRSMAAWAWASPGRRVVTVMNLSGGVAQARVRLPWDDLAGRSWRFVDLVDGAEYDRDGDELAGAGLYVDLPPGRSHVLLAEDVGRG